MEKRILAEEEDYKRTLAVTTTTNGQLYVLENA